MKKVVVALCAIVMSVSVVKADCTWSWWAGDDKSASNVDGCALGLATERSDVKGA